ncbi:site-specific integrase [Staphylococcus delphini]|uniref:tyrosine-type recombinase/integrase n=1 Tax=Staphylococcus delphini TaxID=53344 RepID=UPI00374EDA10
MWVEQYKDKHGKVKYRFYEKYKDPYTNKWRRVSVVMNKNTNQTQKEALLQLTKKVEEKYLEIDHTQLQKLTVHTLLDEWVEYYKKTSGNKKTTLKNLDSRIKVIKNYIGKSVLLTKTNTKFFQNMFDKLSDNYSENQMFRQLNDLRKAVKYAVKFYDFPKPTLLYNVDIPKKVKTYKDIEKEEAKSQNFLEMDQVTKIRDYILSRKYSNKRLNFLVASLIEVQALTGMRIGELQALQIDDIDFENRKINITGTIHWLKYDNGYGYKDTTKTKNSKREIVINKRTIEILKKVILENKKMTLWDSEYIDRGFIFTTKGGNPLYTHKINKQLSEATKALKISKKVTSHTLRHTHISWLVENNISLKTIMKRVGHTDEKTTIKIYTHVTEKMDKQLTDKLESLSF